MTDITKTDKLVRHHKKYKEIHGVDEIVFIPKSEHQKLHHRLRKEGKCNIPPEELQRISANANHRADNDNTALTTAPFLDRCMNLDECNAICTSPLVPLREKLFFCMIYDTRLHPFEVLNIKIEDWERDQHLVTAIRVKRNTKPQKGNRHQKVWLPPTPKSAVMTESTNEMLRGYVSNRKKGFIFINENGEQLSLEWFNERINHYAKLIGIQKIRKYYTDGRTLKLVTCMALRDGESCRLEVRNG